MKLNGKSLIGGETLFRDQQTLPMLYEDYTNA